MGILRNTRRPLAHLQDRLFGRVHAITQSKLDQILSGLGSQLGLAGNGRPVAFDQDDLAELASDENDALQIQDGIAIVPVSGTLVRRSTGMSALSGMTSYEGLTAQIQKAAADPSVNGVLFSIDSPGGECDGLFELCGLIEQLQKPTAAVVDSFACSAAYAIACCADRVYTTPLGTCGSIGVVALHLDQSGADQAAGLRFEYVFAGARKVDGNPHAPLSTLARQGLQAELERIRGIFADLVARNRSVSRQAVLDTEAGLMYGPAAVPMLADEVGSVDDAMSWLGASSSASRSHFQAPAMRSMAAAISNWPAFHSNMSPQLVSQVRDRMHAVHPAMVAKYGRSVEARVMQFPESRSSLALSSGRRISMLVCPYDKLSSNLGNGTREMYQRGCFRDGLNDDPAAVWDHDEKYILGRKSAGTARFFEEADGLHVECDAPDTQWATDLLVSLRRKDVSGSSGGFYIVQHSIRRIAGEQIRVIEQARLVEASVVARPAYPDATASAHPAAQSELDIYKLRLALLRLR